MKRSQRWVPTRYSAYWRLAFLSWSAVANWFLAYSASRLSGVLNISHLLDPMQFAKRHDWSVLKCGKHTHDTVQRLLVLSRLGHAAPLLG